MSQQAKTIDDIRRMADDISLLMADRFGGARRGERPSLQEMLRLRGAALPRGMRRHAQHLARADALCGQPRAGRQQDMRRVSRAYRALSGHLRPLGEASRLRGRAVQVGATLALGLLLLGAAVIWVMLRRGAF